MRVLIVEDDPEWREALHAMYVDALGAGDHDVRDLANGSEAIRELKACRYDILSLDINLRKSAIRQGDGRLSGANGMEVLQFAHEKDRVQGVVVISGCTWDQELADAVTDDMDAMAVRATMAAILRRRFGERGWFFTKPDPSTKGASIAGAIAAWRGTVTRRFLEELAAGRLLRAPYALTFAGDGPFHRILEVRSRKTGAKKTIDDPFLAEFVFSLASHWIAEAKGIDHMTAASALLGPEDAQVKLKQLKEDHGNEGEKRVRQLWQQSVHHYVTVFRRRLLDIGIDPDEIVAKSRRSPGFRLAPAITNDCVHGVKGWTPAGRGLEGSSFDPSTVLPGKELSPDEEAAQQEMQDLKEQFLQRASSEEEEAFSNLPQPTQELILEIFAKHFHKGHA